MCVLGSEGSPAAGQKLSPGLLWPESGPSEFVALPRAKLYLESQTEVFP